MVLARAATNQTHRESLWRFVALAGLLHVSQIAVWIVAIITNLAALSFAPDRYQDAALTRLLYTILTTPWPYWSILAIAAAGTGLSIVFGDEMLDVTRHEDRKTYHRHGFKHRILVVLGLGILTVLAYYQLLSQLGVSLDTH